jgi:CheY-like chemotaxis protein
MKVMIVDDNAEMRGLIRNVLEEVASEFVEYSDGKEAVAAFGAEQPDWALMDVAMGVMDGLTATKLIKSRFPTSQILVITHHDNPKLRERAQEVGASGFLLKEDLLELRTALTSNGSRTAGDDGKDPSMGTY